MSRPELTGHASLFYNEKEARKYNSSSRMVNVQREITQRAIELLLLPPDQASFILDIGCGSGLSGQVLEEEGHVWVGCDVSRDMLQVAHERMEDSVGEKNSNMDESEEESDDTPSTGDLLHHVSSSCFPVEHICTSFLTRILHRHHLGYGNRVAIPSCDLRRMHFHFCTTMAVLQ